MPGEDGLFFVPLALIGIRWWTALPVATVFGLLHANRFSVPQSIAKAALAFITSMVVLPHGVAHMAVAHTLMDAGGFAVVWLVQRTGSRAEAAS